MGCTILSRWPFTERRTFVRMLDGFELINSGECDVSITDPIFSILARDFVLSRAKLLLSS